MQCGNAEGIRLIELTLPSLPTGVCLCVCARLSPPSGIVPPLGKIMRMPAQYLPTLVSLPEALPSSDKAGEMYSRYARTDTPKFGVAKMFATHRYAVQDVCGCVRAAARFTLISGNRSAFHGSNTIGAVWLERDAFRLSIRLGQITSGASHRGELIRCTKR